MLRPLTKWLIHRFKLELLLGKNDRIVLERKILPWLSAQASLQHVLFIGCEWYTDDYQKWFPKGNYWTLDYDPAKKVHGSPERHIVDSMTNLSAHFKPGSLDLIICNGVFGWGLDAPNDIEAAFSAASLALRPGGLFLLGWNDVPKRSPLPLESIHALRAFSPKIIEPLGVSQYLTRGANRHTYTLYAKPSGSDGRAGPLGPPRTS